MTANASSASLIPSPDDTRVSMRVIPPADPVGYTILPDAMHAHLRIGLPALWNDAMLSRYVAELRSQTVRMMRRGRYKGALVDASDYGIQPRTIASVHAQAMRLARTMYGVKAAMLVAGPRPRLQISRMADETGHRVFDRRQDAMDWLLA